MINRHYGPHYAPDTGSEKWNWRTQGACASLTKPDAMYPSPSDKNAVEAAKTVCAFCHVRAACLQAAIAEEGARSTENRFGIRAGLTESQRYWLYVKRRRDRHAKAATDEQAAP